MIASLNMVVRIGVSVVVRSRIIAGEMSYMSCALSGLIFFIAFFTSCCVRCLSWKVGCCFLLSERKILFVSYFGIVWLVLCPTVMKWSLSLSAMSCGSVYCLFS